MTTEAIDFVAAAAALRMHLARRWWALALRGALALAFAAICFLQPGAALMSLVLIYAVYAVTDATFGLVAAINAARADQLWLLLAVEALVSLAAGVAAMTWPGLTVMVFVLLIALRAAIGGVMLLMSAAKLDEDHGRAWMALAGVASVLFAVALFAAPMVGAMVLTWWMGGYALVFGATMLLLSVKLRGLRQG